MVNGVRVVRRKGFVDQFFLNTSDPPLHKGLSAGTEKKKLSSHFGAFAIVENSGTHLTPLCLKSQSNVCCSKSLNPALDYGRQRNLEGAA